MGRVDHYGGLCHFRFPGYVAEELLHFQPGVQHGVVHVDVNDGRTVLDLPGGDPQGLCVVSCGYELGELAGPRHICPLSDVCEVIPPVNLHALQPTYE